MSRIQRQLLADDVLRQVMIRKTTLLEDTTKPRCVLVFGSCNWLCCHCVMLRQICCFWCFCIHWACTAICGLCGCIWVQMSKLCTNKVSIITRVTFVLSVVFWRQCICISWIYTDCLCMSLSSLGPSAALYSLTCMWVLSLSQDSWLTICTSCLPYYQKTDQGILPLDCHPYEARGHILGDQVIGVYEILRDGIFWISRA